MVKNRVNIIQTFGLKPSTKSMRLANYSTGENFTTKNGVGYKLNSIANNGNHLKNSMIRASSTDEYYFLLENGLIANIGNGESALTELGYSVLAVIKENMTKPRNPLPTRPKKSDIYDGTNFNDFWEFFNSYYGHNYHQTVSWDIDGSWFENNGFISRYDENRNIVNIVKIQDILPKNCTFDIAVRTILKFANDRGRYFVH